jgi:hypothetical protein
MVRLSKRRARTCPGSMPRLSVTSAINGEWAGAARCVSSADPFDAAEIHGPGRSLVGCAVASLASRKGCAVAAQSMCRSVRRGWTEGLKASRCAPTRITRFIGTRPSPVGQGNTWQPALQGAPTIHLLSWTAANRHDAVDANRSREIGPGAGSWPLCRTVLRMAWSNPRGCIGGTRPAGQAWSASGPAHPALPGPRTTLLEVQAPARPIAAQHLGQCVPRLETNSVSGVSVGETISRQALVVFSWDRDRPLKGEFLCTSHSSAPLPG